MSTSVPSWSRGNTDIIGSERQSASSTRRPTSIAAVTAMATAVTQTPYLQIFTSLDRLVAFCTLSIGPQ